jgi:hypothetical protein
MGLVTLLAGILVTHVVVWGIVRQIRRDGQHLRRYHLAAFCALEALIGVVIWQSGSWPLLVWMAINAGVFAFLSDLAPPRRY